MVSFSTQKQLLGLVVWLGISFAAAAIGSIASVQASSFYINLVQPEWAPPSSVFGPVWTFLYGCMGVAAWVVWRAGNARNALLIFVAQLIVNALWSWLFFAWHFGALAFVDILVLWVLILITLICFWRIRPIAGVLLIPYLLWVSFAAALNYSIWQLNPQALGV